MLAALSLAIATLAGGPQHDNHHLDPEARRQMAERTRALGEAELIVRNARPLLREGKYSQAQMQCDRAINLVASFTDLSSAHELLADCYLAQGQVVQALKEASVPERSPGSRLDMTRVLILVKMRRTDEAFAILYDVLGSLTEPKATRKTYGLWELPLDRGNSPEYAMATALALRALAEETADSHSSKEDFEAAIKICPKSSSLFLLHGRCLFDQQNFTGAKPELEKAKVLAKDKRTKVIADKMLSILR